MLFPITMPSFFLFFFLMIRRPPRSTLFPTRRSSDLDFVDFGLCADVDAAGRFVQEKDAGVVARSEEHTSELQSRRDLVCRLLLEKKKKKQDKVDNIGSTKIRKAKT